MKYILLILILSSCGSLSKKVEKPFKIKQPFELAENCVERFLRLGVQPRDAAIICKGIHK